MVLGHRLNLSECVFDERMGGQLHHEQRHSRQTLAGGGARVLGEGACAAGKHVCTNTGTSSTGGRTSHTHLENKFTIIAIHGGSRDVYI